MTDHPWPMSIDLSGRVAVVTGGSDGIGAAVVRALAASGAAVAYCARRPVAPELLAAGGHAAENVHGYVADLADADSTAAFLDAVVRDLGDPDILVNNAGGAPSRDFLAMAPEDWTGLFRLNLGSAVQCTAAVLPAMRARGRGRVIMMGTAAAKYPSASLIDYSASKAALLATASALSKEYGRDGVLVNSVLPGRIRTSMWERIADDIGAATGRTAEEVFAQRGRSVPVGRFGSADEVAAVVLFLASDYAAYVNGAAIDVDGGLGAHVY